MKNLRLSQLRGRRRYQKEICKIRAMRKWAELGFRNAEMQIWARKNADNLRHCSCFLCCHNRTMNGPTRQEKRADLALTDE